jgi:UPF0716 family protein affecting phage T7 exclusion
MREIFLTVMCILFVVCYFKVGNEVGKIKPLYILYVVAMVFMFGILVVTNLTLIDQNNTLEKRAKGKCPEYEQINNVYIIKK